MQKSLIVAKSKGENLGNSWWKGRMIIFTLVEGISFQTDGWMDKQTVVILEFLSA